MNRRTLSSAVLVLASFCIPAARNASATVIPMPVHAMFSKTKMVSFNFRNDSGAPLKLKAGETVMTIETGKTLSVKLPAGTSVTAEEATANHTAGSVIAQVSGELAGVTIAVK